MEEEPIKEFATVKQTKHGVGFTFCIIFIIFLFLLLAVFTSFALINSTNENIISGVYIKGINVSGLSKEDAIEKINKYIEDNTLQDIELKYSDYETTINPEEINTKFDVENAVNLAYKAGRNGNVIKNNFEILRVMMSNINIEPGLNINEDKLNSIITDISSKLPETVVQSSYYIDGKNLVITSGKEGPTVNSQKLKDIIISGIQNLNYAGKTIDIPVVITKPDKIDVEKIHNEIYKQAQDAYYTKEPYEVHPHVDGVDFAISIDEVKNMLSEEKEEYIIPLKITKPNITTNQIGTEAFPDLLSSFSTKYSASNKNRTTNLILSSNKINGTVLMPGETFSYNKVVGERTIAAGYKEAAIYSEGQVVDGLGGGICQISTTLYNAVLYANLEIVERKNHMFVPSYAKAGRDATVVYGAIDFKFKNNRNYPIKIVSSVSGGVANFQIYGLKEQTEYEVEIESSVVGSIPYSTKYVSKDGIKAGRVIQKGVNGVKSQTYKILKLNGQIVSKELINQDTYSPMNKLIAK